MAWDIEATDEFKQWFAGLAEAEQISIGRKVDLLEMLGPVWEGPMWIRSKVRAFRI